MTSELAERLVNHYETGDLDLVAATYDEVIAWIDGLPDHSSERDRRVQHVMRSRHAWEYFARHCGLDRPPYDLTESEATRLSEGALLALGACRGPHQVRFWVATITAMRVAREVRRRWPLTKSSGFVTTNGHFLVFGQGRVSYHDAQMRVPYRRSGGAQTVSLVPVKAGWVEVTPVQDDPLRAVTARWHGPEVYAALRRLRRHRPGWAYLNPAIANAFNLHHALHYPRLQLSLVAGKTRKTFELKITRPNEDSSWLSRHLAAIQVLLRAGLIVPPDAYWVNVELGETLSHRPRLHPGTRYRPATLLVLRTQRVNRGKGRNHGQVVTACAEGASGGAQVLWSETATSNGGGLSAGCVVAWIPAGGLIRLSDGASLSFNGRGVIRTHAA